MIMKVVDWICGEESKHESSIGGLGGFFQHGMRWEDFIKRWKPHARPRLEAIRESVIENGLKFGGDWHQYRGYNGTPLFEDDTTGDFSFRAWGDLMAAIWSSEEDKDYCYMDFYMGMPEDYE